MKNNRKLILPLLLVFLFLNTFLLTAPAFFEQQGIDRNVVLVANTLLFLSNLITLLLLRKALANPNPNVFVRSTMAGTLIKLFIIVGAFAAYVILSQKNINKPAVYISIALYFIYLLVEVSISLKLNKQKNA